MAKLRVTWSALVKKLVETGEGGIARSSGPLVRHLPLVPPPKTCGACVGVFWSASSDYAPDTDINSKVKRCKKIYFAGFFAHQIGQLCGWVG